MPKRVLHSGDVFPHQTIHAARRQPRPLVVEEQRIGGPAAARPVPRPRVPSRRVPRLGSADLFPVLQPRTNRRFGGSIERDDPLLAALSEHAHDPAAQIDVLEAESDELAQPQSRRVEQLQDRPVAAAERRRDVRHLEQPRHLRFTEMRRQALLAPRRADERRRVAVDRPFTPQVPAERPDRRELARRRRARVARACECRRERRGCADGRRPSAARSERRVPRCCDRNVRNWERSLSYARTVWAEAFSLRRR